MAKGHHLKKPTKYEVRESTWKTEFELLRRTGYPKEKVLAALSVLPDPSTLPDYVKETLTEDGKYSHTIVLPMIFWAVDIVSRNSNRREFLDS